MKEKSRFWGGGRLVAAEEVRRALEALKRSLGSDEVSGALGRQLHAEEVRRALEALKRSLESTEARRALEIMDSRLSAYERLGSVGSGDTGLTRVLDETLDLVLGALRLVITKKDEETSIDKPFGCRLFSILDFLCSKKTMEGVVNQTIADIREEQHRALQQGRTAKARWISILGYWAIWKALGLNWVCKAMKAAAEVWKAS